MLYITLDINCVEGCQDSEFVDILEFFPDEFAGICGHDTVILNIDTDLDNAVINVDNVLEWQDTLTRFKSIYPGINSQIINAYTNHMNETLTGDHWQLEAIGDSYRGEFSSNAEFAEDFYREIGDFPESPWDKYVDWDDVFNGELAYDIFESDGYYFRPTY